MSGGFKPGSGSQRGAAKSPWLFLVHVNGWEFFRGSNGGSQKGITLNRSPWSRIMSPMAQGHWTSWAQRGAGMTLREAPAAPKRDPSETQRGGYEPSAVPWPEKVKPANLVAAGFLWRRVRDSNS